MARALINIPAKAAKGQIIEIKTLVSHPMETGFRPDNQGKLIPRDIINRLATVVGQVARTDDIRQRLLALGAEPLGYTADETTRWLRDDVALWAPVVKASGATAE